MKTAFSNHSISITKLLALFGCAALIAPESIGDPPLVVEALSVGPNGTGSNTVSAKSAAIGEANTMASASHSLAAGFGNILGGSLTFAFGNTNTLEAESSAAFGNYNTIDGFGYVNFVLGADNQIHGGAGHLVVGSANSISDVGSSYSQSSALFGDYHLAENAQDCLVSGANNVLNNALYSAAIGYGLILNSSSVSRLVTGYYNSGLETSALFVVGNGTSAVRSNAFVVEQNGDARVQRNLSVKGVVRVPQAGDILMTGFEEGTPP